MNFPNGAVSIPASSAVERRPWEQSPITTPIEVASKPIPLEEMFNNTYFIADQTAQTFQSLGNYNRQEMLGMAYWASLRYKIKHVGLTYLASFDGRHRSGKSVAASTVGWLFDKTFADYYENRLVQEPRDFIEILERIREDEIKGAVIQVDEAGVSMASTDWFERWMKALTKTMQVFGYLHPIVLFVAPIKDFVDARLRKMFHAYYSVSRFSNDFSVVVPYDAHYNTVRQKYYYKKPLVRFAGTKVKLDRLILGKPPEFIMKRYQDYEMSIKPAMLQSFADDIRKGEIKAVKEAPDMDAIIVKVCESPDLFSSKRYTKTDPILDAERIEFFYKIPTRMARYVKRESEVRLKKRFAEIEKVKAEVAT